MKILLHNVHKIIILRYPTYVYQFIIFLLITKIECWPVFKQDPWSCLDTLTVPCSIKNAGVGVDFLNLNNLWDGVGILKNLPTPQPCLLSIDFTC